MMIKNSNRVTDLARPEKDFQLAFLDSNVEVDPSGDAGPAENLTTPSGIR